MKNSNTDFEFTPGQVYVGSWQTGAQEHSVIFKPHTSFLHERCQGIGNGGSSYFDQEGCCTGGGIRFRKANTDEKTWLETCIKAGKLVPLNEVKLSQPMQEKIQIGDWVMCLEPYKTDNYLGEGGRLKHSGPYQIEEIDDTYNCVTKISGIKVMLHFHRFRLCTPNEIPQSSEIKVGDWVKCIGESATPPGKSISSGWEKDLVFKVTSIGANILWGGKNSCGVYNVPGHVRKAYSDEIPEKERSYVCKAVTTGNGASLAVGQEYTYGNKNGYRNTVWVVDSITETTVTFRQKDKPNVKVPYSIDQFPRIINKDQFWLVEDDNFAYFAKIIDSGSGMSPADKGKTVKVLKKRPEGAIANDYSSYDTYFEAIDGVHYQTLKIYDFKYGRCAANMLQREGIQYAEDYDYELKPFTENGVPRLGESNPIPKIDNVLIWNGEVSNHINPDQIKLSDSSVQIKVPTSASVTLKNTENEVKIIVKQSQSIKIN